MNKYETVFILTPVLSETQIKEAVKKFESEIESFGGKVTHTESWGIREFAYRIQKIKSGFYFLLEFEGEGDLVSNLELSLKRDERVVRFLTVKMDKHHIEWAEKRKARMKDGKSANNAEA